MAKKPIWGGKNHLKDSQKMENKIAKVFETIKLNKKLMPRILLKHLSWKSCLKVYLSDFFVL